MGRCIFGRFQGVFFEIPRAIPGYAEGYLYTHRQATSRGLVTHRSNPSYIYNYIVIYIYISLSLPVRQASGIQGSYPHVKVFG